MIQGTAGLLLLLLAAAVTADQQPEQAPRWRWSRERLVEKYYWGNLRALQALLSQPQMPERYLNGRERFSANLKGSERLLKFSWNNCGSSSDPVQIKSLSISPDPVQIPGDINLSFDIVNNANVSSPLEVDLDIKKKVAFWWVAVPCVDNVGSCDYADFCPMLPDTCPPSFQQSHVPCNCPAMAGEYSMTEGAVTIPELPLPSWLTSGDYKIQLTAKNNGNRLLCVSLQLSLD